MSLRACSVSAAWTLCFWMCVMPLSGRADEILPGDRVVTTADDVPLKSGQSKLLTLFRRDQVGGGADQRQVDPRDC